MERLRVDTKRVRACADDLDVLRSEFASQDRIANEVGDAVGAARLAAALEDFAGDWSRSRARIAESMGALARTARAIADELERVDVELAAGAPRATVTVVALPR